VADHLVVFVEEDVAASQVWQEAEDGQTDGFQFLPNNVMFFVLYSPEAARFESAVQYCSPTISRTVAVYVR
jgi:redox-regulated HSP33 family molecular chaperone